MKEQSLFWPALLITFLITIPLTAISDQIGQRTGWQSFWLSSASMLVGMEAVALRTRMVAGLHETQGGALRYLAAEIFGLAALARIVATLGQGADGWRAMTLWIIDPLAAFDTPFLLCLFTLLSVALISRGGIAAIAALTPNPPLKTPAQSLDLLFFRSDASARRREAVAALTRGVAWGATILIFSQKWGDTDQTWFSLAMSRTAIFLIGGLFLIALAQRRALLAEWQSDGVEIDPNVSRRLGMINAGVIVLLALLAIFLPVNLASAIPEEWQQAVMFIIGMVLFIATILSLLFIGLLSLLFLLPILLLMLLMRSNENAGLVRLPPPVPMEAMAAVSDPPIWPGIIFWLCIAILTALAFWTILRRQTWARYGWQQTTNHLRRWLTHLRHIRWYRRRPSRPRNRRPAASAQPRAPIDAIIASYHTALRYAAERGFPRQPPQTPTEFAEAVDPHLPDGKEELRALTNAYQRAAYAGRPSDRAEQRQISDLLRRFRRKLR